MTKYPKVFIVILNWNRADDTIECLKSVSQLSVVRYQLSVAVVDNASSDNSVEQINKFFTNNKSLISNHELIKNQHNKGFAGGNKAGIHYALDHGADCVLILNNDTRVHPQLVNQLIDSNKKDSRIGLASPKIYFERGFEFHKDRYKNDELGKVIWYAGGKIDWDNVYGSTRGVDEVDHGQYDEVEQTDFATGTCMLISRKLLETVGMFDERYYLYYEDTDLSERARIAGFKVMYIPNAVVWHKVAQSSGIGSGLSDYYTTRNRMVFGMKYAPLRTKIALLRESVKILLTGRRWQKIGVRDYYLCKLGKGSWNEN